MASYGVEKIIQRGMKNGKVFVFFIFHYSYSFSKSKKQLLFRCFFLNSRTKYVYKNPFFMNGTLLLISP